MSLTCLLYAAVRFDLRVGNRLRRDEGRNVGWMKSEASDSSPLYRRPLWSDWAFWVALVAFGFGVAREVSTNYTNPLTDEVEIAGNELAFAIDATIGGGYYVLILSVVPALIRRSLRRRRTDPGEVRDGSSASKVSQQQDASASTWTLGYGWSPSDLAAVATRLIEEKIPHTWEGVRLFAPQRFENQIESLLDEVERVIGPRTDKPDAHTDELDAADAPPPAAKYCIKCGVALHLGSQFCAACGSAVPTAPMWAGRTRPSWRSMAFIGAVLATLVAAFAIYLLGSRGHSSEPSTTRGTTSLPTTEALLVDLTTVDFANFTHAVTCAEGPKNFTLVNGQASDGDIASGDPFVQLHDVYFMDVDGDGGIEALADMSCSQGANLVTSQVLTYQAAPERPVRLGSTIFGFGAIVDDSSIMTHEPVYGADDPRCCPSGYRRDTYRWSTSARDFIITDSQTISESELPSATGASAYTPGEPCALGSDRDCIDPEGDGEATYLIGGGDCMDTFAPDSSGLCSDLDGDGYAGYPDSG